MCTCTNCGKQMAECPICRQYVVRSVMEVEVEDILTVFSPISSMLGWIILPIPLTEKIVNNIDYPDDLLMRCYLSRVVKIFKA